MLHIHVKNTLVFIASFFILFVFRASDTAFKIKYTPNKFVLMVHSKKSPTTSEKNERERVQQSRVIVSLLAYDYSDIP